MTKCDGVKLSMVSWKNGPCIICVLLVSTNFLPLHCVNLFVMKFFIDVDVSETFLL